ncbi:IS3 family transposase [Pseudarthrobacter sp. NPDC058196]|uniref:IS3 family transposase n=1 Tax=Pseudarthrobacter sp. NPDC058196 TaxID=3346376 RepID=UPI0036D987A4
MLKLMRSLELVCKVRRRKRYSSYKGDQGKAAPNALNREFEADRPNRWWVTDVTEFRVGDRKLYLSPIMDHFYQQIIYHAVSPSPNLELTNASLRKALSCLKPGQRPVVHSDQGFQYQNGTWRTLESTGVGQSTYRKANCYDNAVTENFFGHLKEELISTKLKGPEPGAIPRSGPRGLGSYIDSPTFGDQFMRTGPSPERPDL